MRCSRVIAPMSSVWLLGAQVDHLAADHAGGAGRRGERRDQLAAHRRIAMRVGLRQHLEGQRQQPVAGEDGGRLVELLVQVGRPRRRSPSSIAGRSSWTSE